MAMLQPNGSWIIGNGATGVTGRKNRKSLALKFPDQGNSKPSGVAARPTAVQNVFGFPYCYSLDQWSVPSDKLYSVIRDEASHNKLINAATNTDENETSDLVDENKTPELKEPDKQMKDFFWFFDSSSFIMYGCHPYQSVFMGKSRMVWSRMYSK
ncbi:hypothetical protein LJB99_00055 [Deltaproteobacteria bacterium OttesenSCG-928-K17]|nr:hypothetical protein [Deltaproteobacteria bacterium OttesenSCG-928-K17]